MNIKDLARCLLLVDFLETSRVEIPNEVRKALADATGRYSLYIRNKAKLQDLEVNLKGVRDKLEVLKNVVKEHNAKDDYNLGEYVATDPTWLRNKAARIVDPLWINDVGGSK